MTGRPRPVPQIRGDPDGGCYKGLPDQGSGVVEQIVDQCDIGQVAGTPCPVCDAPLEQEHAHTRCRACGWLGKCCE